MNYFIYLLIISICFIIYSEITVSNILIRPNSQNKKQINIVSLVSILLNSFFYKTLWNKYTLDINYCFILCISSMIYFIAFYLSKNIHLIEL